MRFEMSVVSSFNGNDSANLPDVFEPLLSEPSAPENTPVCQMSDAGNSHGVFVGGKQVPDSWVVEEHPEGFEPAWASSKGRFLAGAYAAATTCTTLAGDPCTFSDAAAAAGARGPQTVFEGFRQTPRDLVPRPEPLEFGVTTAFAMLTCTKLGPIVGTACAALVADNAWSQWQGDISYLAQGITKIGSGDLRIAETVMGVQHNAVDVLATLGGGLAAKTALKGAGILGEAFSKRMLAATGRNSFNPITGMLFPASGFAAYEWWKQK
jgi:hypothetical protein